MMCVLFILAILFGGFYVFQYCGIFPKPHFHDWDIYEKDIEIHKNKRYSYTVTKCSVCGSTALDIINDVKLLR